MIIIAASLGIRVFEMLLMVVAPILYFSFLEFVYKKSALGRSVELFLTALSCGVMSFIGGWLSLGLEPMSLIAQGIKLAAFLGPVGITAVLIGFALGITLIFYLESVGKRCSHKYLEGKYLRLFIDVCVGLLIVFSCIGIASIGVEATTVAYLTFSSVYLIISLSHLTASLMIGTATLSANIYKFCCRKIEPSVESVVPERFVYSKNESRSPFILDAMDITEADINQWQEINDSIDNKIEDDHLYPLSITPTRM